VTPRWIIINKTIDPTPPHCTQVQHFHYEDEASPIFQLETFGFRKGACVDVFASRACGGLSSQLDTVVP
jgi:hypothetical protein